MTTSRELDWAALVQQADRDWARDSINVPTYRFSNGRSFKTREIAGQAYSWWGTGSG
jgi:hypothetical protein